jgi:hypothetical protein
VRQARIALRGLAPGDTGPVWYGNRPLADLLAAAPVQAADHAHAALGGILSGATTERGVLLSTLRVWFAGGGVAREAARPLHVHPNTVRYRLWRVQELTGLDLINLRDVGELYVALEAIRLSQVDHISYKMCELIPRSGAGSLLFVIDRAVLVPCPPLLVPELAAGAAAETETLRTACVAAARELAEAGRDWLAIAVDHLGPAVIPPVTCGTFRGYGVDVPIALADDADAPVDPDLPLPALVAGWLRARAQARTVQVRLLSPVLSVDDALALGAGLAADSSPIGLLVLADGSNRVGKAAPAGPDRRAEPFEDDLRAALGKPDPTAIAAMDSTLATELGITARPALQVLAGAALATERPWHARELYSAAPYGVGYHVVVWDRS